MARLSDSERLIWAWRARAEAAERERDEYKSGPAYQTVVDALRAAERERDEALAANEAAKQFSYASHRQRAEAAEARVREVERERDRAYESNAAFMSEAAYSQMHDAWHNEQERAEQAEARLEQAREALYNHGYGPGLCRCEDCSALLGSGEEQEPGA